MISRRALLLGVPGAALGTAASLFLLERKTRPFITRLPEPLGLLSPLRLEFPQTFGVRRVFLDPGHGAAGNPGNTSCFGREEQDFTITLAREVAARLKATNHFEVKLSREGNDPVEYRGRVEAAELFRADVFLSLHSDIRGQTGEFWFAGGRPCRVSLASPGFSALWSDEGDAALSGARRKIAQNIARRMRESGFSPYNGNEYGDLYEADAEEKGVFVDRHAPAQRIFVLRRPTMPSVLIETHHALDPREARLWEEPRTLDAFTSAVAMALVDAFS